MPLRGEKIYKPRPQNKILVHLRGSFQNFQRAPTPFLGGSSSPSPGITCNSFACKLQYQGLVQKHNLHSSSFCKGCNNKDVANCTITEFIAKHVYLTPLTSLLALPQVNLCLVFHLFLKPTRQGRFTLRDF